MGDLSSEQNHCEDFASHNCAHLDWEREITVQRNIFATQLCWGFLFFFTRKKVERTKCSLGFILIHYNCAPCQTWFMSSFMSYFPVTVTGTENSWCLGGRKQVAVSSLIHSFIAHKHGSICIKIFWVHVSLLHKYIPCNHIQWGPESCGLLGCQSSV